LHFSSCRVRQTLKATQAVAADHVGSVEEIVKLLDSN
jgi:hypothetical protein